METDLQKVQRQVVRHPIEFAISDGSIPVEQRDPLFVLIKSNSVFLRQRFVNPIALFAVAFGKFWRKWNDPFQHEFPSLSPNFSAQPTSARCRPSSPQRTPPFVAPASRRRFLRSPHISKTPAGRRRHNPSLSRCGKTSVD